MKGNLPLATQAAACAASYQAHISALAGALHPRVLLNTRGSGNFGEQGSAAFFTFDKLPSELEKVIQKEEKKEILKRTEIDLGPNRLAFYIDNVLTHQEADALASCAESILESNGHSRFAPGIQTPPGMRVNEAAHWYPPNSSSFLPTIFDRFRHLVPDEMDGLPLYEKLSEKVAQFKYAKGDHFNQHIDGLFPGQGSNSRGDGVEEWNGVVSGMSVLFYLNDDENDGLEGGQTRLWTADGSRYVDIAPRKGRVLFFRRGSPDAVLHSGLEVTGEVPKYMALINLAYGELTSVQSMN